MVSGTFTLHGGFLAHWEKVSSEKHFGTVKKHGNQFSRRWMNFLLEYLKIDFRGLL
jgi:hypothetical protein